MNAGAVLLTDCVFWFIIVPFLEIHDYSLNVVSNLISYIEFFDSLYKNIWWSIHMINIAAGDQHALSQRYFLAWWCCFEFFGKIQTLNNWNIFVLISSWSLSDSEVSYLQSFPCFRIAYFFFWTIAYVIFQWALHSLVHIW